MEYSRYEGQQNCILTENCYRISPLIGACACMQIYGFLEGFLIFKVIHI